METLLSAIKSDDITEVKKWFITNHKIYKRLNFYRVVESVDNARMLCTLFEICGEEIRNYYRKRDKSILIHLIREGKNFKMIEASLKLDGDCINHIDESGMTPLVFVVLMNCEISLIEFLLENNADVNVSNTCGETPLHGAQKLEVVKLLIKNGASLNCRHMGGFTPLMTAIRYKRSNEIILEFLMNGTDVEARNHLGQTCLHLALQHKYDEDIINQICCKTTEYNVEDNKGLTPLCYALHDDNWWQPPYQKHYILKLISKGFVLNSKVFMHAVKHCSDFNLIASLASYVDIRCVDKDENCVLHHADDSRLVELLARRGASVNHRNSEGKTPLMDAIIRCKNVEIIESLLFWGSDVKELDYLFDIDKLDNLIVSDSVYDLLVLYGMSVDVKDNFIQCFLLHKLHSVVDGKPTRLNDSLLRHIFLSNENVIVPDFLMKNAEVTNLILKFQRELNKMKEKILTNNISYYEFCLKHYKSFTGRKFIDDGFIKANHENIKKLFPVFFNEVIVKIKINIKINKQKSLCRSFLNVTLAKQTEQNNNCDKDEDPLSEHIVLDCDCLYILGTHLNERAMKCVLAAAIN